MNCRDAGIFANASIMLISRRRITPARMIRPGLDETGRVGRSMLFSKTPPLGEGEGHSLGFLGWSHVHLIMATMKNYSLLPDVFNIGNLCR